MAISVAIVQARPTQRSEEVSLAFFGPPAGLQSIRHPNGFLENMTTPTVAALYDRRQSSKYRSSPVRKAQARWRAASRNRPPLQFKLTDHRIPVSRSVSCDERFSRKKSTLSPIFRRCPRWSFLRHHLLEDVFGMIGTANEGAGEDPPDAKVAGHFAQVSEFVGMVVFSNFRVLH